MSGLARLLWTPLAAPLVGLACMGAALLAIRLGLLPPLPGFGLFMAGCVGGGLTGVVAGALAAWRGTPGAWAAVAAGAVLLASLLPSLPGLSAPPIHDLTTDLEDPPEFRAAAREPANRGRDLGYPVGGDEVPEVQRRAYPALRPQRLDAAPEAVFDAVVEHVAPGLGWDVIWSHRGEGVVEARAESRLFRFVDDVVVRVRPTDGGSLVDVRSTSRVGRSDLGANAARIRRFQEALRAHLEGD